LGVSGIELGTGGGWGGQYFTTKHLHGSSSTAWPGYVVMTTSLQAD
jgi:hypothetical protein